jgi:hypothetical protein
MTRATTPAEDREDLERRADAVRDRLILAIGALGRKRDELRDARLQVRRHLALAALVGGALAVAVGGAVVAVVLRVSNAQTRERRRRERWRALARSFRHPERVARGGTESIGASVVKRVLGGVLTAIGVQLARHAMEGLLSPPSDAGGAPQTPRMAGLRRTFHGMLSANAGTRGAGSSS